MTAKTFLAKLNAMAATNGKKDKLAIIQTFDAGDRAMSKWALDPTISYYIAKLDAPSTSGVAEFDVDDLQLLADLSSRNITGAAALAKVNKHLEMLHPDDAEVLRRIILKDLRCGVGATLINAEWPGLIVEHSYMRCSLPKASNIEKWNWDYGVFCQLKCDGSFARVSIDSDGFVLITTRQGNTYPDVPALRALVEDAAFAFDRGTETHGELTLWVNGVLQPRQIGNGMLNSLMQGGDLPDGAVIRFDCWDQIPLAAAKPKGKCLTQYEQRFKNLQTQVFSNVTKGIQIVESHIVKSKDEALAQYRDTLARGLEGVILKNPLGIWSDHTSPDCVKWKLEVDVDLELVGFRPGEPGKRTEATFGALICRTSDGLLEVGVSGFKRDVEARIWEQRDSVIGEIVCVRANGVMYPSNPGDVHSLFLPRFVEVRYGDKRVADTLQDVIDQFANAQ